MEKYIGGSMPIDLRNAITRHLTKLKVMQIAKECGMSPSSVRDVVYGYNTVTKNTCKIIPHLISAANKGCLEQQILLSKEIQLLKNA